MKGSLTFAMIKPDTFKNDHTNEILFEILKAGFKIRAIKITMLTRDKAEQFYSEHRGKEFFERLVIFMSSGPVMPLVLEKPDAVNEFRKLIGKTDPQQADEGTIRKKYGTSTSLNAIHGSDSDEHAEREWAFFFSRREIH